MVNLKSNYMTELLINEKLRHRDRRHSDCENVEVS